MESCLDYSEMKIRFLIGIFFISTTTLCLQISLTRFFSVSQQYHFAFLVVSIAFLGYGSAGSFISLFQKLIDADKEKFLSATAILFSLTILASFLICNALPFDFIKLSWDTSQIFSILLYYVVLSIPFLFAGVILSFAITRAARMVNTLYFFDLLGAGTGTVLALFIFLPKGDKGVFAILTILALVGAWLFSPKHPRSYKLSISLLLAGGIFLFFAEPSWLSFHISDFKAMPVSLRYPEAKLLFTKWNAISRVDVIHSPAVRYAPGLSLLYNQSLPNQLGLLVDGGELNAITQKEDPDDPSYQFLSYIPSSLPYFFLDRPRVLVLEPKGGLDILASLHFGASHIKVIENNPLIDDILNRDLSDFSGHIYQKKNVQTAISTSRAALIKEKEHFDLVVFSLADVFGSAGTGQFGVGENYLYTEESFQDALSRLSDDGIASMTLYLLPPPRQEIRLLATWIEALRKITDYPEKHLIVLRSWGTISFFIKKSPYMAQEINTLKEFCEKCLFDLVFYPGMKPEEANIHNRYDEPLYHNMTHQLLSSKDAKRFYKDYLFHVKPVSDNRPFFANFFKLGKIKTTFTTMGQKWLPFLQGEFLVPLLFIQAVGVAFLLILIPALIQKRRIRITNPDLRKIFLYFGLIGMSFMFVEITLIQKFILFLGHPLYSTAFILFALLFSSGIGSLFSKKLLGQNPKRNVILPLWLLALLILIYSSVTPTLFKILIGSELLPKMLFTFSLVFPLGFLMGFPFPTGIRLLEKTERRIIPWAWATNAFSSVVNSVGALMIAFWGGYNSVLLLAALGYLVASFFLGFASHRNKRNP
jgi:hypothetical protein